MPQLSDKPSAQMPGNGTVSRSLGAWLERIERLHPREMDLGLDRVREVARRLGLLAPAVPVITVAGTNGKGTTVACLQALFAAAGLRVGAYTSPHLVAYNERIAVGGEPVGDAAICEAFEAIETARGELSLTYFEFGTLAALYVFRRERCDILVLEVGLGGRLDAVNIIDCNIAVLTTVDLDHQQWLGETREAIGLEKAGITRAGRPAVCADPNPPASILQLAAAGVGLRRIGVDFSLSGGDALAFSARDARGDYCVDGICAPRLAPESVAAAIEAVRLLTGELPPATVRAALASVRLPGRFDVRIVDGCEVIIDVAHNPAAAARLAANLHDRPASGRTRALVGMLGDKDQAGFVHALAPAIDGGWVCTDLPGTRGGDAATLCAAVQSLAAGPVASSASVVEAWRTARSQLAAGDRLVVAGSFITAGEMLKILAADAGA